MVTSFLCKRASDYLVDKASFSIHRFYSQPFDDISTEVDRKLEPHPEETIIKLKFISSLKPDEKIDIRHLVVQPNTYLTSFIRTKNSENRKRTLQFIFEIMNNALVLLEKSQLSNKESDRLFLGNLTKDIKNSIEGIRNIKTTYRKDRFFCQCIDTLIDYKIRPKISDAENSIAQEIGIALDEYNRDREARVVRDDEKAVQPEDRSVVEEK